MWTDILRVFPHQNSYIPQRYRGLGADVAAASRYLQPYATGYGL